MNCFIGLFLPQKSLSIRLNWIQWIKTARLRRKTNLHKSKFALDQIKWRPNAFDMVLMR